MKLWQAFFRFTFFCKFTFECRIIFHLWFVHISTCNYNIPKSKLNSSHPSTGEAKRGIICYSFAFKQPLRRRRTRPVVAFTFWVAWRHSLDDTQAIRVSDILCPSPSYMTSLHGDSHDCWAKPLLMCIMCSVSDATRHSEVLLIGICRWQLFLSDGMSGKWLRLTNLTVSSPRSLYRPPFPPSLLCGVPCFCSNVGAFRFVQAQSLRRRVMSPEGVYIVAWGLHRMLPIQTVVSEYVPTQSCIPCTSYGEVEPAHHHWDTLPPRPRR